jgi:hypothetical protein
MHHTSRILKLTVGGAVAIAGAAAAQTPPKEGRYDYTSCYSLASNAIGWSKSYSASTYELLGTILSNPPGGLFHKSTVRCVGMNRSFAGKSAATAACEGTDPDGDKFLYTVSTLDGKTTRDQIAGTGKYEGMVASGATESLGPFPEVKPGTSQNCNHQTGTYKLK